MTMRGVWRTTTRSVGSSTKTECSSTTVADALCGVVHGDHGCGHSQGRAAGGRVEDGPGDRSVDERRDG